MIEWFKTPHEAINSVGVDERFTERLNNTWFKKASGGVVRLGLLLTTLGERVTALERAAKPTQPSSMGRTATGIAASYSRYTLPNGDLREQFIRTIDIVMNGRATKAGLSQGGYRITVERDDESLTGGTNV